MIQGSDTKADKSDTADKSDKNSKSDKSNTGLKNEHASPDQARESGHLNIMVHTLIFLQNLIQYDHLTLQFM